MTTAFKEIRRLGWEIRGWLCAALLSLLPLTMPASDRVSIQWNPNSEAILAGYKVYFGTASGQYTSTIVLGKTTNTTVSGLQEGVTYFFAVTAYDTSGLESDPSIEVSYTRPSSGPQISTIPNQVTLEDTAKVVSFTASRGTNLTGTLSFTASSSDSALVPAADILIAGSFPNYTATLTPRPNSFGVATITLTVTDGTQATSSSFVLTVNSVNDAPSLNSIGNLSISEDAGLQSIALTGINSGAPNENQNLTIQAVSSNPALIPAPVVTYTTPSATGTLRFSPATNANGSATITVTLNDGQGNNNIATRSFNVAVAAVNDAPAISSIPGVLTTAGTPTTQIPFTIQDVDSPSLSLSASSSDSTLLPTSSIIFSGTGNSRTVQLTPATGLTGQCSITIAVTDGQLTASTIFPLTVTPSNATPMISAIPNQSTDFYTPFLSWWATQTQPQEISLCPRPLPTHRFSRPRTSRLEEADPTARRPSLPSQARAAPSSSTSGFTMECLRPDPRSK
jgi:fibronectin type 3 domain-containing protein